MGQTQAHKDPLGGVQRLTLKPTGSLSCRPQAGSPAPALAGPHPRLTSLSDCNQPSLPRRLSLGWADTNTEVVNHFHTEDSPQGWAGLWPVREGWERLPVISPEPASLESRPTSKETPRGGSGSLGPLKGCKGAVEGTQFSSPEAAAAPSESHALGGM